MLIAYAGREERDWSLGRHCLFRFRRGADTLSIAKAMNVPEAEVQRTMNIERSNRLGLPSPYQA